MGKIHVDAWRTTYAGIIPDEYLRAMSYEKSTAMTRNMLENPYHGSKTFVADTGEIDGVVGAATAGLERQNHPVYKGELFGIYILESYQHQGIGQQLVHEVKNHLRQLGLRSMRLWVLGDNPYQAFYKKLGGEVVDEKWDTVGGKKLKELAYGWRDLRLLKA
jgi:ribosomal protein S18 acetylase RimI-like enzyme